MLRKSVRPNVTLRGKSKTKTDNWEKENCQLCRSTKFGQKRDDLKALFVKLCTQLNASFLKKNPFFCFDSRFRPISLLQVASLQQEKKWETGKSTHLQNMRKNPQYSTTAQTQKPCVISSKTCWCLFSVFHLITYLGTQWGRVFIHGQFSAWFVLEQ